MATVIPYIPERITVHLGTPNSDAENVTVSFPDYVKNVASSEIYPTWDEDALRANIYAIVSFALNRVYTEFYRSRGYNYDITNSTAYDQYFVNGRSFFTNISRLVDELFNDYLRRPGFVEPLAAKFCNGTTAICEGLSQWGSENLAQQGYTYDQILKSYYGNVEIVNNAPVEGITPSYPGRPLRRGTTGPSVVTIQTALNRISQSYPAIPKIPAVDGIFGSRTEAAVRKFQEVFNLAPDGIVGPSTWYALVRIFVAVTRLAELRSEGQRFYANSWATTDPIEQGDRGIKVEEGFTNVQHDINGGTVRSYGIKRQAEGLTYYSLPTRLAIAMKGDSTILKKYDDDCNIRYSSTHFPIVPFDKITENADLIRNRIVILGAIDDKRDMHYCPIGPTSGISIIAFATNTLINDNAPKELSFGWMVLLSLFLIWFAEVMHETFLWGVSHIKWLRTIAERGILDGIYILLYLMLVLVLIDYFVFKLTSYYYDTAFIIMSILLLDTSRQIYDYIKENTSRKANFKFH